MRPRTRLVVASLAVLLTPLGLAGCSGGPEPDAEPDPAALLTQARDRIDETPGVRVRMTTERLPDGIDGVLEADGVGTHAPAFEGTIRVAASGVELDVDVVAVDGVVYAQLPFTRTFVTIDPADYGAPDPAALLSTETGVSSWLTEATSVERTEEVRDGSEVLTSFAGTLPGTAVAEVIPSADSTADFAATFTLTDDNVLDAAVVTGPFYPSDEEVTYTVEFTDYGVDADISKP